MGKRKIQIPKIERRRVGELKAAPYNPRAMSRSALSRLRASMERWGLADIPVINKRNGRIIGGHQRVRVLPDDEIIPVVVLDLSAAEEKALNVTLNNPHIAGEFTDDLTALLKSTAGSMGAEAFADVGLDQLMQSIEVSAHQRAQPDQDRLPDLPDDPVTKVGDLWHLGDHRLLCGDSRIDIPRLMGEESCSFLLTDPPYGINVTTDWSGARGRLGGGSSGKRYPAVEGDDKPYDPAPLFDHLAADEMFLFGGDYYAERIPGRLAGSWLVWDKRKESQADGIGSEFELVWSRARHKRRVLRHAWFGFLADDAVEARNRVHPTQKPVALMGDILGQWGRADDLVVDPYAGSGPTLLAADQLGRRCYALEIDRAYCDVIVERWQQATGGVARKA